MDIPAFLRTAAATGALALASVALPTPASAQAWQAASPSKTMAILGGSSRLAAILSEQGAPARLAPAMIAPASYRAPSYGSASFTAAAYRVSRPALATAISPSRPAVSPGVASGRPDVFGSLALAVGHTPLDGRWRKVRNAGLSGSQAAYAHSLRGRPERDRLEAVNHYVNARVRFTDDSKQFGRADVWESARDTLRRGAGDCEDYAIAKLQLLRAAGVSDRDLYLVIVKDLVRRADHAVLVVRTANEMVVLDNGTDQLLDSESIRDYRPVFTFAANGVWTHGYRRQPAPVQLASVVPTALVPAAR